MCEVKRCKGQNSINYYGRYICWGCWKAHCSNKINLKKIFKIKETEVCVAQVEADKLLPKEDLNGYM